MARDFAKQFYSSNKWKDTRNAYMKSVGCLCERCFKVGRITAGEIVHHKVRIDVNTINDPNISLSFDNLELLCRDCHAAEHEEIYHSKKRWKFSKDGELIALR